MPTPMEIKAEILADLWMNYRNDEEFLDFCEYNDLGLPLAYLIANNIVKNTPTSEKFLEETFMLLLGALGIEEDAGYESLDDLFDSGIDNVGGV